MKTIARIREMMEEHGVTAYQISQNTTVSEATLSRIFSGKTKNPHQSTINEIYDYLQDTYNRKQGGGEGVLVSFNGFKMVPLITYRAQAGFLAGWGDPEYLENLPKVPWEVDKEYKGTYLTFEVSGNSMESVDNPRESIYEGDLLLCREVGRQHWRNKLHIKQWDFVVCHREQGVLVKRIMHHDTATGDLTLHSLNPYYEDFTVNMNDLIAIFNIVDIKRSMRR